MRTLTLLALTFSVAAATATHAAAPNYAARQTSRDGVDVVVLSDAAHKAEVTVVPSMGNMGYEMKVNGKNVLNTPDGSLAEFKAKGGICGIPFLWPYANRIDQDAYYVNGKKYILNPNLGNLGRDQNKNPIHGLVRTFPWSVVSVKADGQAAEVTSRLEYWKYPDLMAQFPFAHTIDMTYRLKDGVLEVETAIHNLATEPMPVAAGFHSIYKVNDAPFDDWTIHLGARDWLVLSPLLIPTGETKPVPSPDPLPLKGVRFDDVFTNMIRGADGRGEFWIQGKVEKVSVIYGPKYDVAVVVARPGGNSVVMESMAAITNAFNLANAGIYKGLQMIPPGGEWRESFWVKTAGF